ncbi:MAG: hypothetical protein ACHBNF_12550 [Chromatiales bacterium]
MPRKFGSKLSLSFATQRLGEFGAFATFEKTEWRIVKQWEEATTALAAIERANPMRPSRPF